MIRNKQWKMTIWTWAVLWIASFLPAAPAPAAQAAGYLPTDATWNMAANPGFEEESLEPWITSPPSTTLISRDTAIKRTGEASLRFNPRVGNFSNVRQQITLQRGKVYTFSAWVRATTAEPEDNVWAHIKMDYNTSTDASYKPGGTSYPQVTRANNLGSEWVQLYGTHTYNGSHDSVTIYMYLETCQRDDCDINVDDVFVFEELYAASLNIAGDDRIPIPAAGIEARPYEAVVLNQHGTTEGVEEESVIWTYDSIPAGVSVTGDVNVEVDAAAEPGYLTLRASLSSDPQVAAEHRIIIGEPAPFAEQAAITGTVFPGGVLEGEYIYTGARPEGNSLIQWYLSDAEDGPYMPIEGETDAALIITESMEGQYVRFEVTPVDENGTAGVPVSSEPRKIVFGKNVYYVDPVNGDDANPGTLAEPFATIERARDEVRQFNSVMQEDITVFLRGGEYNYSDRYTSRTQPAGNFEFEVRRSELTFDERDSGKNGYHVAYEAYPGEVPVISGGKAVTGWTLHDAEQNIYKAQVEEGFDTRQLYVNGQRAVVARSDGPPADLTLDTSYGHTTTDTFMADWNNLTDVELVYHSHWVQHRIKVDSITLENGLAVIRPYKPQWDFAVDTGIPSIYDVEHLKYVENAYELLDAEGEWYLDRSSNEIFYKPRSGEDMATAEVIVPVVDELLTVEGSSLDTPVQNLHFKGIAFEYSRWLRPNAARSHHANQNNVIRDGNLLPEAAVTFNRAVNVSFERNTFTKLGSTGLLAREGIQHINIVGNKFYDLSGSAMNIGDHRLVNGTSVSQDIRMMPRNVTITDNYIRRISVEYDSGTGISMSMGRDNVIAHNEISEIPYTGIHLSWHTDDWTKNVRVENNYIHDLLTTSIYDGGAIYTLGTTQGSATEPGYIIQGNYMRNQLNDSGVMFPDNTSTWWYANNNVVDIKDTPSWHSGSSGLNVHIHSVESSNHRFLNLFSTSDRYRNNGTNNSFEPLRVYPDAVWPREAIQIIEAAGLRPGHWDLWDDARYNQLLNSGFETRQTNVWTATDAHWAQTASEHRTGVQSARIERTDPLGYISQPAVLSKGMTYELSASVKTATSAVASLYVDFGDQRVPVATENVSAGVWTKLAGTYVYDGDDVQAEPKVYVQLDEASGTTPYYVDDVQAIEVPEQTAASLQTAVATAQALLDGAVEGDRAGQYAPGSKSEFAAGIGDATALLTENLTAQQWYRAMKSLYAHQIRFETQQVQLGDRTELAQLIAEAVDIHDNAVEGSEPEMYRENAKAELAEAIAAAELVVNDAGATEHDVELAVAALMEALYGFEQAKVILNEAYIEQLILNAEDLLIDTEEGNAPGQYTPGSKVQLQASLDEAESLLHNWDPGAQAIHEMLGDAAGWSNGTMTTYQDYTEFKGRGVKYTGDTYLNEAFTFELKYDYIGGDWPGFSIRSQSPTSALGVDETGYLLIFKEDVWELQKWVNGSREMLIGELTGYTPRWGTIENTHIRSGERHRVQFGAANVEDGVRLYMIVDGEVVFDHVDEVNPIREEGYFAIYSSAAPLQISPVGVYSENLLEQLYTELTGAIETYLAAQIPWQASDVLQLLASTFEAYRQAGDVKQPLTSQLDNALRQVEHHYSSDRIEQAKHHLERFSNHLTRSAREGDISTEAQEELERLAEWLAELLQ